MLPKELPPALQEIIARHIRSVEQLEILLLVSKDLNTTWTAAHVYEVILSSRHTVERWLDELTRSGLLERVSDPEVAYRGCSSEAPQVQALGDFYRTAPVRVIEAIYKRETNAAQSFADAFKIKNDQTPS